MSFFVLVGTFILETQVFVFWKIFSNYFSNNVFLSHSLFYFWSINCLLFFPPFFFRWGCWVDPRDLGAGKWVSLFVCSYIFPPIVSHSISLCFAFRKISLTLFFSNECFISAIVVLIPTNSFLFSECSLLWPLRAA